MRSDIQQVVTQRREIVLNAAIQMDPFKAFTDTLGFTPQGSPSYDIDTFNRFIVTLGKHNVNKYKIIY